MDAGMTYEDDYRLWVVAERIVGQDPKYGPSYDPGYPFRGWPDGWIKELWGRHKRGRRWEVPLEEVGHRCGVSRQAVSEWVNERLETLPRDEADALCRAFGYPDAECFLMGARSREEFEAVLHDMTDRQVRSTEQFMQAVPFLTRASKLVAMFACLSEEKRNALLDFAQSSVMQEYGYDSDKAREASYEKCLLAADWIRSWEESSSIPENIELNLRQWNQGGFETLLGLPNPFVDEECRRLEFEEYLKFIEEVDS